MKNFFEFDIKNKKSALFYAAVSSLLMGILLSVPILIAVEYIDRIADYDTVIYFTSACLVALIFFLYYCLSKKGTAVYDDYITVNFGLVGYGLEPVKRKIKINSIKGIQLVDEADLNYLKRDVYGGNYDNGYVKIIFGKGNNYYCLALKNAEEFINQTLNYGNKKTYK